MSNSGPILTCTWYLKLFEKGKKFQRDDEHREASPAHSVPCIAYAQYCVKTIYIAICMLVSSLNYSLRYSLSRVTMCKRNGELTLSEGHMDSMQQLSLDYVLKIVPNE
jgi:hypothetical protein